MTTIAITNIRSTKPPADPPIIIVLADEAADDEQLEFPGPR